MHSRWELILFFLIVIIATCKTAFLLSFLFPISPAPKPPEITSVNTGQESHGNNPYLLILWQKSPKFSGWQKMDTHPLQWCAGINRACVLLFTSCNSVIPPCHTRVRPLLFSKLLIRKEAFKADFNDHIFCNSSTIIAWSAYWFVFYL